MVVQKPKCPSKPDRLHLQVDSNIPAANHYCIPSTFGKVPDKKSSAAFSMSGRLKLNVEDSSPGPAMYDISRTEKYMKAQPKYTMAPRNKTAVKVTNPGPGAYDPKIPTKGPKGFTFGSRTKAVPLITSLDSRPRFMER